MHGMCCSLSDYYWLSGCGLEGLGVWRPEIVPLNNASLSLSGCFMCSLRKPS